MEYEIKNERGLYIKLDKNGRPVTCTEQQKGLFEYSKAMNICGCLPKTIKNMGFRVEAIPDIHFIEKDEDVIKNETYIPSENVVRWINKLGQCEDVLNEVNERNQELNGELSNIDLKLQDILHNIEMNDKCDMFNAWKMVNDIRKLRRERREVKDEKLVLSGIKSQGITYLNRKSVQKCVDGLSNRKYKLRIVEEDEYADL